MARLIFAVIIIIIVILFIFLMRKYNKGEYKLMSGNSYIKTLLNKGFRGEYMCYKTLKKIESYQRILVNVYLPIDKNKTTEIDLIYICNTGINVLESKNYGGWIFGDENSQNWTQTFKNGSRKSFLNPIRQNKNHIKHLKSYLSNYEDHYFSSIIVFGQECKLKRIELKSKNSIVTKRWKLFKTLKNKSKHSAISLSNYEVDEIYVKLKQFSYASEEIKSKHISNLKR